MRRLDTKNSKEKYLDNEGDLVVASDFDHELETAFFVDNTKQKIGKVSINGTDLNFIIGRDVAGAEGLAVDWIGK